MPTKYQLITLVQNMLQDSSFAGATVLEYLNRGQLEVAGGILFPPMDGIPQQLVGTLTPPLPDLMDSDTVSTSTSYAYVSMPTDYQRNMFFATSDASDGRVNITENWLKFKKKWPMLDQDGSVSDIIVKGRLLYYQGIPSSSDTLTLEFYRKPSPVGTVQTLSGLSGTPYYGETVTGGTSTAEGTVIGWDSDMSLLTLYLSDEDTQFNTSESVTGGTSGFTATAASVVNDEPDGIPESLQTALLTHYAAWKIYVERIEDGMEGNRPNSRYNEMEFYKALVSMVYYIGSNREVEPSYIGDEGLYTDIWIN